MKNLILPPPKKTFEIHVYLKMYRALSTIFPHVPQIKKIYKFKK